MTDFSDKLSADEIISDADAVAAVFSGNSVLPESRASALSLDGESERKHVALDQLYIIKNYIDNGDRQSDGETGGGNPELDGYGVATDSEVAALFSR